MAKSECINVQQGYFSTKGAAEYLGVTERYIRTLIYTKQITYSKAFGKILISRAELEKSINDSLVRSKYEIAESTQEDN